jgi:hypothetical protein
MGQSVQLQLRQKLGHFFCLPLEQRQEANHKT